MRNNTQRKHKLLLRGWLFPVLTAVLLLGLVSSDSLAQTQFGTVNGRVLDSSGAIVPGATVTGDGATLFMVTSATLVLLGWLPGTARKAWSGPKGNL